MEVRMHVFSSTQPVYVFWLVHLILLFKVNIDTYDPVNIFLIV